MVQMCRQSRVSADILMPKCIERPVVASGPPNEAQAVQGSESGTEVKE